MRTGGTVYTAVTGSYDTKPLHGYSEANVKVDVRRADPMLGSLARLWNREQKLVAPPESGMWSVYLDGSFSPKVPLRKPVEKWLDVADMALFRHPWRTCAYEEIDECVKGAKITAEEAEKMRSHLLLAGFPRDFGLWACGMIARRVHANALQLFMAPMWWHYVQDVPRDQIWLPFVLWKLRESLKRIHTIDADIYNNKWLSFRRHGS